MNNREKAIKLSVVIPAYNERNNIGKTINELLQVINSISNISDFQIIVADDHSSDGTYDVINQMNDRRIGCLRLSRRSGSLTTIRAGLAEVKGNVVLCIAADGQENPSSVKDMISKWQNGADIVWGLRKDRVNDRAHIRFFSKLFYRILNWLIAEKNNPTDLSHVGFCLLDRQIVNNINSCREKNTSLFALIAWLGYNQDSITYERRLRLSGKSNWDFRSRLRLAKTWIISFSGLPIKLIMFIGFLTASAGFLYALIIFVLYFFIGHPIQGWASMMIVILVVGGLQMMMLGIIGEYLWQTLDESKKRPLYFIESRINL